MIRETRLDTEVSATRIEVLSNLSLTLDRLAGAFLLLSGVTLLVALLPTLLGYWPIMVIAVIHLAVVGWCFRLAWRGNWARQEITIDTDRVRVVLRTARYEGWREWPTGWVRIRQAAARGEPRILLGLGGQQIEIGRFVPAGERVEAASRIMRALQSHSASSGNTTRDTASS